MREGAFIEETQEQNTLVSDGKSRCRRQRKEGDSYRSRTKKELQ
jgi:hypothetical protein